MSISIGVTTTQFTSQLALTAGGPYSINMDSEFSFESQLESSNGSVCGIAGVGFEDENIVGSGMNTSASTITANDASNSSDPTSDSDIDVSFAYEFEVETLTPVNFAIEDGDATSVSATSGNSGLSSLFAILEADLEHMMEDLSGANNGNSTGNTAATSSTSSDTTDQSSTSDNSSSDSDSSFSGTGVITFEASFAMQTFGQMQSIAQTFDVDFGATAVYSSSVQVSA